MLAGSRVLFTLEGEALASRLQPGGQREASATMTRSSFGFAPMHIPPQRVRRRMPMDLSIVAFPR